MFERMLVGRSSVGGPRSELSNFERRKRRVRPCVVDVMGDIDGNELVRVANTFVRVWMGGASSPMANAPRSWVGDVVQFGRMVWTAWLEL